MTFELGQLLHVGCRNSVITARSRTMTFELGQLLHVGCRNSVITARNTMISIVYQQCADNEQC